MALISTDDAMKFTGSVLIRDVISPNELILEVTGVNIFGFRSGAGIKGEGIEAEAPELVKQRVVIWMSRNMVDDLAFRITQTKENDVRGPVKDYTVTITKT